MSNQFLECSKIEKDLLSSDKISNDDVFSSSTTLVTKKDLEAPERKSNYAPHELVAQGSRLAPKVSEFVEGQRRIGGTAHAEKLVLELNAASQINRGPPGAFASSRLHLDMLLGRDESYSFGDYLGGYDKEQKCTGSHRVTVAAEYGSHEPITQHALVSNQNIPKPNPLHTTFKNHNFPANFLNETNVLDYFCNPDNIFYDMKSCNQVIRMQQIGRPLEECLQSMAGEQYVLHFARPPLFVICKQQRNLGINQNIVTPLAYYYIINGTVYQAPDAFSLVQSRLLGAVAPLGQAFEQMLKFSRFNVAKGYSWEFDKKPAPEGDEENDDEEDEALLRGGTSKKKADSDEAAHIAARSSTFQEQRTTNILQVRTGDTVGRRGVR
uniref:Mediator of RNA polymerase II transcription subunit 6 n=1 Tax=Pristionchus pacificus TaxID=54126 RepID=A0A2A6C0G1_PRIPA|eukprot:PDM71577.1 mdt-6 [Pristionchus pacificus]